MRIFLRNALFLLSFFFSLVILARGADIPLSIDPTTDTERFNTIATDLDIQIDENIATITIQKKLLNGTQYDQNYIFTQSVAPNALIQNFYVNQIGQSFTTLEPKTWWQQNWENIEADQLFRQFVYAQSNQKIFRGDVVLIPSQKETDFKLVYQVPVQVDDTLKSISIDTTEIILPNRFDLRAQINGKNLQHFWHNLPLDGLVEKTPKQISYWYWSENFSVTEPIRLYWSETSALSINYETSDQVFTAYIKPAPDPQAIKKISLHIDTSGSMSGNKWYLVQDLTEWLLSYFDEETVFEIQTHSQLETKTLTNEFEPNNRDLKKKIKNTLPNLAPLGKSALEAIEIDQTADMVIIITDEEQNMVLPSHENLVVLNFSDNEALAKKMLLRSGFFMKLFANTADIIQTESLAKKFRSIQPPIKAPTENFLPNQFDRFSEQTGNWFIQREFKEPKKAEAQDFGPNPKKFLAREWAKFKIAEIFRSIATNQSTTTTQIDDLLYLGRTYGINTSWFNAETRQSELKKTLSMPENTEQIPYKNWHLENRNIFRSGDQPKIFGFTPINYYETEKTGRSIDFYDRVKPELLVQIAPFSAAQKKLLEDFPDIFAPIFSLHEQVEFCLQWKCFSIREGFRTESLESDRAFLDTFPIDHWAKNYLVELVNQQLIETDKNGNLDPEKILTRGELAHILFRQLDHENAETLHATSLTNNQTNVFMDIPTDSPYYQTTKILSEQKIMNGFMDGEFKPFERITRAQALKTIMASNGLNPTENFDWVAEPIFADADGWERPWVEAAFSAKKINGEMVGENRYFWSTRSVKLSEVAKLLVEFSKK